MKEIKRNRVFIKHFQYARHPPRCTFTLVNYFLSHKSQGIIITHIFKTENSDSERLSALPKVIYL